MKRTVSLLLYCKCSLSLRFTTKDQLYDFSQLVYRPYQITPKTKEQNSFVQHISWNLMIQKSFPKGYFWFNKVKYPDKTICVVTGLQVKYKDPPTGLLYPAVEAYKFVQQHCKRIREERLLKPENVKKRRKKELVINLDKIPYLFYFSSIYQ